MRTRPGQTTSIIATSIEDDFDENARASCAYDWSDAAGCGTTLTLIPVFFVNCLASAVSRTLPFPTESPTNVIVCPPYFFLIAAALGTFGAGIVAAALCACAGLLLLAAATPEEGDERERAHASRDAQQSAVFHFSHVLSFRPLWT